MRPETVRPERPHRFLLEGLAAGIRAPPDDVDALYSTSNGVPLMVAKFVVAMFDYLTDQDIAVPFARPVLPSPGSGQPSVDSAIQILLSTDHLSLVFLFDKVRTAKVPVERLRVVDSTLNTLINLNGHEDCLEALQQAEIHHGA